MAIHKNHHSCLFKLQFYGFLPEVSISHISIWFDSLAVTPEIRDLHRFLVLMRQNLKTPTLEAGIGACHLAQSEPGPPPRIRPLNMPLTFSPLRVYAHCGENIYWF